GVAQLSVTSGAREAADLGEELQQAEAGLTALLRRFSVEQVHELPELQSRQQALLRRRKELQAEVKRLAGSAKDLAGLENQRAATQFELSRLLAQVGLTAEQLASQQIGNEAELEAAEQTARSAEDEAQRRLQAAQESLQARQEAEQTLTQEGAALGTDEQVARTQVEALLKRHGEANVLELREREQAAAAALREREEALEELQEAVPAADPQALAAAQRQALEEIEADERRLHDARVRFEVNIEQAQSQGRYEDLVLLEEQQQSVQQQLARARLEAHSIRLLRQVLEERRQDAVSPQLPHLEEAIQRMMLAITGQDRLIKVDDAYKVEGMLDRRSEDEVHGFDALSAGTREQLDLVTRVALGEAYADKYGPTMMVLDDALLYTDPERHDKVKLILQRAEARKLQVFIFTSHPDRYRGIVEEPFRFDLAALAAGARASG
ncbi:MAG: hypothetical protein WCP21_21675, partial [Armatimonadota bacterium]